MANPYGRSMNRSSKSYPNGTNVPKTGPSNSRGPSMGPRNNRPAAKSTSTNVGSPTYQPFPGARASGSSGVTSAADTHTIGQLNTPIKKALGARRAQGPDRMLGGSAARVKPTSGNG